jgi:hypothetical protein
VSGAAGADLDSDAQSGLPHLLEFLHGCGEADSQDFGFAEQRTASRPRISACCALARPPGGGS